MDTATLGNNLKALVKLGIWIFSMRGSGGGVTGRGMFTEGTVHNRVRGNQHAQGNG